MPIASPAALTGEHVITREGVTGTKKLRFVYVVTLASLLSCVGIIWDISWHASIGRDRFLTPPHSLIYLGAIFGGLFSGIQVLGNSFSLRREKRDSFIKVWGV